MTLKVGKERGFQVGAKDITNPRLGQPSALGMLFGAAGEKPPVDLLAIDALNDPVFKQVDNSEVDLSETRVDLSEKSVLEQQQILSDAGYYVTDPNHPFYQDGIAGPVTNHAIALYENPIEYASSHIVTAMNDNFLTPSEMMMLQGDLKALGFPVGVTGHMDEATKSAIDSYVEQNENIESPKFLDESGSLKSSSLLTEQWEKFTANIDNSYFLNPLLAHIAHYEAKGGDYNIWAHDGETRSIVTSTVDQHIELQEQFLAEQIAAKVPEKKQTTAAGAYQVNLPTFKKYVEDEKIDGNERVTENFQDEMAEHLLVQRGGLEEYLTGKIDELEMLHMASKVWAYIPDPMAGGLSHYAGVGNNKSLASIDEMVGVLKQVKSNFEAQQETTVAKNTIELPATKLEI